MIPVCRMRMVRRPLGYVAEKCPSCDQPSVCRLLEVTQEEDLTFIPLGRGHVPLDHEAECLTCSHRFRAAAITYHTIAAKPEVPLEELIPLTSPWLGPKDKQALAKEGRLRRILAPLMRYDVAFRNRALHGTPFDWNGAQAVVGMIFGPLTMAAFVMSGRIAYLTKPQAMSVAVFLSGLLVIWGVYMILSESGRYYRRQLLPLILNELESLAPTKSELETAVLRMKRLQLPSWCLVKRAVARQGFLKRDARNAVPARPDTSPA
jgi:hypothetical protein